MGANRIGMDIPYRYFQLRSEGYEPRAAAIELNISYGVELDLERAWHKDLKSKAGISGRASPKIKPRPRSSRRLKIEEPTDRDGIVEFIDLRRDDAYVALCVGEGGFCRIGGAA